MTENWKQFLTKQILKESSFTNTVTISCDGRVWLPRTYGNRIDLMDLYEKVYEDGKWCRYQIAAWLCKEVADLKPHEYTTWLFCLDKTGYEERCKMVAEFYGWDGKK